jgi:bifunctional pyridoxal-dependent enzyme with beta-cystathionase and maltose regulon repressor activities
MILHSLDVQEELNKFIDTIVNVKYPNLIKKYEILNPIEIDEEKISTVEKKIVTEEQPIYPQYISVYEEKGNKYIQYNKQSKAGRFSKKIKILTNDIQKELDSLVLQFNEKYPGYNLEKQKISK